jgi:hypothetical protein
MTEPTPGSTPPGFQPLSKKDAKAQAAAQKAYEKSQKNWFARHKVLTGVGALILVIILFAATSGGGDGTDTVDTADPSTSESTENGESGEEPKTAALGTPVRDGKFEFTVRSIEPGPPIIGTEDFGQKPQGEFLLVNVKVENIGNEPQSFFGDNQYLYVGERKYSADTEAAIYLEDSSSLFEEINPGNSLEGVIVFDVPKGSKPTKLELHDSAFSGGVEINL